MPIEKILMPQLGESVTEGTIERWLVKPGDTVKKYDPLAEVITDKVNAEIPSSFEGTIAELLIEEGTTVEVGTVVCTIQTEGQEQPSLVETAPVSQSVGISSAASPVANVQMGDSSTRYSPAVLKLAGEYQLDISAITGTGHMGRVTRKDVLAYIESGAVTSHVNQESTAVSPETDHQPVMPNTTFNQIPKRQSLAQQSSKLPEIDFEAGALVTENGDMEVPVSKIRSRIAQNMTRSKHEIPHAWMMIEVDVTNLVQYRNSIKDEFLRKEGFPLTYFAFFAKVVAQALKEYPMINSTWAEDKIIIRKDVNLSIAVGVDDELYVPVVRNADEKTIKGLARDIYELSQLAKQRSLKISHITGGTFTLNNTGSFGSVASNGIINHPQAAILQIESIVKKPVIIGENMIAPRDMVNICMSLDHRILDGLICGKFLNRVKYLLENVNKETMSVY